MKLRSAATATLLCTLINCTCTNLYAGAVEYEIIDLGTIADRNTFATAVNEQHQVTGYSAITGGQFLVSKDPVPTYSIEPYYFHAFAWQNDARIADLGFLGPDVPEDSWPKPDSRGFDLNDTGHIVGRSTQPGEEFKGMLWLAEEAFDLEPGLHLVPGLSPAPQTQLFGINNTLQIVGESWQSGPRPILWERIDGQWQLTDLGDLGGPFGRATSINELGQIAGQANVPSGDMKSFLWLPEPAYGFTAGIHNILPSFPTSQPNDINDLGQVVGDVGFAQGFIWLPEPAYGLQAGGSFLDPTDIPNGVGATAEGISNDGVVVGEVLIGPGPSLLRRAMIWQDGQMQLLEDIFDDESGWWLISATDVTDDGVIVGYGLPPGDTTSAHGFLIRPTVSPNPDINGDGIVGPADLAILLGSWGECEKCPADLNADGTVGPADLAILLGTWGNAA